MPINPVVGTKSQPLVYSHFAPPSQGHTTHTMIWHTRITLLSSLSSSKSKNSERFEASPVSFCNLKIQYKHKNNLIVSFCNLKSAWNVSTNSSSKHSDLKISMVSQTTNLTSADLLHWLSLFLISYLSLWFEKSTHLLSSLGSGGSYNLCCFWDRRRQR